MPRTARVTEATKVTVNKLTFRKLRVEAKRLVSLSNHVLIMPRPRNVTYM